MTLEHGKKLLDQSRPLLDVAAALGLSSSSKLHDHFVQLEAVTPGEYKKRGKGLHIDYGVHPTPFGRIFVAVTARGVCRAAFLESDEVDEQLAELRLTWPLAFFASNDAATQAVVHAMFGAAGKPERPLSLYVAGTNFQIAVWRALLQISPGTVASYTQVATSMRRPKSARAVGNAIGANPIALLVPCHRVIQQSGALGGYRWGQTRKQMIQMWEKARTELGPS